MSTSGWITKEDAAAASAPSAGTNDLASRLGGFGLQDKTALTTNGGSQATTTASTPVTPSTTATPANGEAASDKPQTVPDGWSSTSTPAATPAAAPSSSTTATSTTTNAAEGASGTATPANGEDMTQDQLAAAEKEAQEMSHEDGESPGWNSFTRCARSCMLLSWKAAVIPTMWSVFRIA